jgi:hypothetical protein
MTEPKTTVRGRPASGRGIKVNLYLSKKRIEVLKKLGRKPAKVIYKLIDEAGE